MNEHFPELLFLSLSFCKGMIKHWRSIKRSESFSHQRRAKQSKDRQRQRETLVSPTPHWWERKVSLISLSSLISHLSSLSQLHFTEQQFNSDDKERERERERERNGLQGSKLIIQHSLFISFGRWVTFRFVALRCVALVECCQAEKQVEEKGTSLWLFMIELFHLDCRQSRRINRRKERTRTLNRREDHFLFSLLSWDQVKRKNCSMNDQEGREEKRREVLEFVGEMFVDEVESFVLERKKEREREREVNRPRGRFSFSLEAISPLLSSLGGREIHFFLICGVV